MTRETRAKKFGSALSKPDNASGVAVVLALAARLVARRGSGERLPLVLVHTLTRALLELHGSGRGERQEDG